MQTNTIGEETIVIQNAMQLQIQKQKPCRDCDEVKQAMKKYRQTGNKYRTAHPGKFLSLNFGNALKKLSAAHKFKRGGMNFNRKPLYSRRNIRYLLCE